jgi:hypothetical protein
MNREIENGHLTIGIFIAWKNNKNRDIITGTRMLPFMKQ